MSQNVTLNSGSGGATLGTDGGPTNVQYQIIKIGYSVTGVAPTQVSTNDPLPVTNKESNASENLVFMQLILTELRVMNTLLQIGLNVADDIDNLRADPSYNLQ